MFLNVINDGKQVEIPLGKSDKTALIDIEDVDLVSRFTWYAVPHYYTHYAYRIYEDGEETHRQTMHRLISGLADIDHADRDGLNNTRANLRKATPSQQKANRRMPKHNTSGYLGVSWDSGKKKWRGTVIHNGKKIWAPYFDDPIEAAKARDIVAFRIWREYANLNFPLTQDMFALIA